VTQHRAVLIVAVMVVMATAPVATQSEVPGLRRGHLTVSAGMIATGGYPLGDRNAEIRRNSTGTTAPFTLFRADSEIDGVRGVEARVALALTRTLAVEVGGTYGTPQLGVTITQDNEADPTTLVSERIEQYTVDVSGVFQLSRVNLGRRARPYVTGGGGYLRQLHAGRLLLETGSTIHLGGGIRYWLRGGLTAARALGVRADTRVVHRSGGVDFEDRSRTYPVFSLLGFVGF
jgi:hypothetical protein